MGRVALLGAYRFAAGAQELLDATGTPQRDI